MQHHGRSLEGVLLASTILGFASSVMIARSVGPSGRGEMTFITVWVQVLGFAGAFMLDAAIIVLSRQKDGIVTPVTGFHEAVRISIKISVASSAAAFLLGLYILGSVFLAIAMAAGVLASAAYEIWNGYLLAVGRRPAYLGMRLSQPLIYAFGIASVSFVLSGLSRSDMVIGMTIGLVGSLSVSVLVSSRRHWPTRPARSPQTASALLRFARSAQIASMIQYVNNRLDLLALPFRFSNAAVGIYAIGAAPAQVLIGLGSAGTIRAVTGEMTDRDLRAIGFVALVAGGWAVSCPWLITLVFGPQFQPSVPVARILALGVVPGFALQQARGRLLGQGRTLALAAAEGAGSLVFLTGFLAAKTVVGVAWASSASYLIALIAAETLLHRGSAAVQAPREDV
jgi:O-antigen/teichoic acid export membrane protein